MEEQRITKISIDKENIKMNKKNGEVTYKEIYLQPESFLAVNNYLEDIFKVLDEVFANQYEELIFTGCGTSFYLAQTAAHIFASYTNIPAKAVPCSELYFFPETFIGNRRVLVLPITRKSYTTEVKDAIHKVRTYPNVKTLAITCDKDSALYNDYMILSPDTAEDSVIMTRSFTSMVYLAVIMSMYVSGKKSEITAMGNYDKIAREVITGMDQLAKTIVEENKDLNLYITLGQGEFYGIANECMNKMKEMGLTNSETYYSLEYRHGPMSLVDENTLILFLCNEATLETDARLLTQMNGYGATTVAIGEKVKQAMPDAHYHYELSYGLNSTQYAPILATIGQLMGYYIAEQKSIDADHPRHLTQAIVL